MWQTIGAILRLISIALSIWTEKNKHKKKMKKDALKEVTEGISKRDPAKITAGFDRLNRI